MFAVLTNPLAQAVMNWLLRYLMGEAKDLLIDSVKAVANEKLSGEEKKAKVVSIVKSQFSDMKTSAVNAATEMAVTYLKQKKVI